MAEHVCPFWIGYILASPLRKLFEHPEKILGPLIRPGMCVLDVGCAMGFFSNPAARLVGAEGRVICVDIQERMLDSLRKRARKAQVIERIETRPCTADSLGIDDLAEGVDLALAIHVVHECPDPEKLLKDLATCLKPGGTLLLAEPKGHVSDKLFDDTGRLAQAAGLTALDKSPFRRSHSALFRK